MWQVKVLGVARSKDNTHTTNVTHNVGTTKSRAGHQVSWFSLKMVIGIHQDVYGV